MKRREQKPKALFVVEPDFLDKHVGVKRVIFYYMAALERQGVEIDLATPASGQLWLMHIGTAAPGAAEVSVPASAGADGDETPRAAKPALTRSERRARPRDYESIVITNPWLCALGLPALPGCIGIAFDLVPNLIAAGVLRFSNSPGIYRFARDHDTGYRYFIEHARKILCISESTRRDLVDLYRPTRADLEITSHIPFDCSPEPVGEPQANTVLLVNVLDMRKNLDNVAAVLERAHATTRFGLVVVAKERIAPGQVLRFFERMVAAGIPYAWYRDIDDDFLVEQYRKATVLLFPSYYEGLGLPILEAQQQGVPAISTDLSSCPEVNMNPDLCFAPDDVPGMADALGGILSGARPHLRGERLRQALFDRLATQRDPAAVCGAEERTAA